MGDTLWIKFTPNLRRFRRFSSGRKFVAERSSAASLVPIVSGPRVASRSEDWCGVLLMRFRRASLRLAEEFKPIPLGSSRAFTRRQYAEGESLQPTGDLGGAVADGVNLEVHFLELLPSWNVSAQGRS